MVNNLFFDSSNLVDGHFHVSLDSLDSLDSLASLRSRRGDPPPPRDAPEKDGDEEECAASPVAVGVWTGPSLVGEAARVVGTDAPAARGANPPSAAADNARDEDPRDEWAARPVGFADGGARF